VGRGYPHEAGGGAARAAAGWVKVNGQMARWPSWVEYVFVVTLPAPHATSSPREYRHARKPLTIHTVAAGEQTDKRWHRPWSNQKIGAGLRGYVLLNTHIH
jgi:hypothetical protein